ncbi:MAG: class C sortase [Lachnospiraceae bacterium]|nr:class C sortase [Lachnospiraceae bacterium]
MAKFLKKHLTTIILYLVMLIGLCLLLYPSVADWWNSRHQSQVISSYVEAVESMNTEDMEALLEAARAYNKRLSVKGISFLLAEEEMAEYESLLDISGSGVMGYVQIPKINVSLPVYHGTDEAVLQIAVGHIAGTSLPVGGEGTHSVLSGHRGLPSAKLFTDLDQIEEGDIFTVSVLNETITYKVDQIRIVLPEDVTELQIIPGEDYCTLVTCTPYGINTHRILVRGRRIENLREVIIVNAEAVRISPLLVIPAVGIPIIFMLLVILLIYYRRRKPLKTEKELLEELKK